MRHHVDGDLRELGTTGDPARYRLSRISSPLLVHPRRRGVEGNRHGKAPFPA